MPKIKKHTNPTHFREAIEGKIARLAKGIGTNIQRLRRHVVFERLLSRFFVEVPPACVLKGGYAMELLLWNTAETKGAGQLQANSGKVDMELRWKSSRTTKDIDLTLLTKNIDEPTQAGVQNVIRDLVTEAIAVDMDDHFSFEIIKETPLLQPPLGGISFTINAILAGRSFAKFKLDIGAGDVEIPPSEKLTCPNLLSQHGIDCPQFLSIRREQQFAEKIHAYTKLRQGEMGSRARDLIDMALLIGELKMDKTILMSALKLVFQTRNTHNLPPKLPVPPERWRKEFLRIATSCQINLNLNDAFRFVNDYYVNLPRLS